MKQVVDLICKEQVAVELSGPVKMEVEGELFISSPKVRVVQTMLLPRCSVLFKEDTMEGRSQRINRMSVVFRSLSMEDLIRVMDGQVIVPSGISLLERGDSGCRREMFEAAKAVWYSRIHERDALVVGPWGKRVLSSCLTTPLLREIDWDSPVVEMESINYYLKMIESHFTVSDEGEDTVVRGPAETIYLAYHFDPVFVFRKIAERFCAKFLDNNESAIAVTWPCPQFPRWLARIPEHESAEPIRGVFVTDTGIVDFNERADIVGQLLMVAKSVYVWTMREKEILEEVYPGIQVGGLLRADPEGTRVLAFEEDGVHYAAIVKQESMSHVNIMAPLQNWGFGPKKYLSLIFQASYRVYTLTATEAARLSTHYISHGSMVLFTDGKSSYDVGRGLEYQGRLTRDALYLNVNAGAKIPCFPSTGVAESLMVDISHLFSHKNLELKFRQFQVWLNDQKIPFEGMEVTPSVLEVVVPAALPLRTRFLHPDKIRVQESPVREVIAERPKSKIQLLLSDPTKILQVFLYQWRRGVGGSSNVLAGLTESEISQAWHLICANIRDIPQIMSTKKDEDPLHTFVLNLVMNLSLTGGIPEERFRERCVYPLPSLARLLEIRDQLCQPYCTKKIDGVNWVEFLVVYGDDSVSTSLKLTDAQWHFLRHSSGPVRSMILRDPSEWLSRWNDGEVQLSSPEYVPCEGGGLVDALD